MKSSKRRYLLLQITADRIPSRQEFLDALWGSLTKLYGEYGASQSNLTLIKYDEGEKRALARVSLESLQSVRASLALITRIAEIDATVNVIGISGTLKSLREKSEQ